MNSERTILVLTLSCMLASCLAHETSNPNFVVIPSATNAIQIRLYTNASPDSSRLFNTFDILARGETLLQSPALDALKSSVTGSPSNTWLHNILVDGKGPALAATNSMAVIEQASGPDWKYTAFDVAAAYRGRLETYKRGILFVAPDLFVVLDHLVAKEPVRFQMLLHPSAATQVDPGWRDLRLGSPKGGFVIHAPGVKGTPRSWERVESPVDQLLAGTVTMQLGPTNKLAALDLITVFAVHGPAEKKDFAFSRLVESDSAVGVRIHREGWPILVAFKLDPASSAASLTGFGFKGPVGVDVFKPKRLAR